MCLKYLNNETFKETYFLKKNYSAFVPEVEKYDENLHEKTAEQGGTPIRYYFENLKISIPQIKLSVFTSNKLPLDLKVSCSPGKFWKPLFLGKEWMCLLPAFSCPALSSVADTFTGFPF